MWHCLDCTSGNSCVNYAVCSSLIVQTRCVVIWSHLHILRESAVCEIMSHRNFSNYLYKLFNEEIWIVQDYNYFTSARQIRCMSSQFSQGRRVISLRSFFLRSQIQRDYRPKVIGNRSIGAPQLYSQCIFSVLSASLQKIVWYLSDLVVVGQEHG